MIEISARGRGRQHKAWGGAQRNPREDAPKIVRACGAGDRDVANIDCDETQRNQLIVTNCRPLRGLDWLYGARFLGFRCAPPQALCCRLLRRLKTGYAAHEKMRVMASLTVRLLRHALLFFALLCSALPAKAQ